MTGIKRILFFLFGVASLTMAAAEPKKVEGAPDEWMKALKEAEKHGDKAIKDMKAEVEKLTSKASMKTPVEELEAQFKKFTDEIKTVEGEKKKHDDSKKAEKSVEAKAVVAAAVKAVDEYFDFMSKFYSTSKTLAGYQVADSGSFSKLKYLKTFRGSAAGSGAFMYAILPLVASAAFFLA